MPTECQKGWDYCRWKVWAPPLSPPLVPPTQRSSWQVATTRRPANSNSAARKSWAIIIIIYIYIMIHIDPYWPLDIPSCPIPHGCKVYARCVGPWPHITQWPDQGADLIDLAPPNQFPWINLVKLAMTWLTQTFFLLKLGKTIASMDKAA